MKKLSGEEITKKLEALTGWSVTGKKLHREFKFSNFVDAFAFMTKVAKVAEEMNHHPEWANVYNQLRVDLTTHDANGITEKDFLLAKKMNEFFKES